MTERLRAAVRWLGAALIAAALVALPLVIWVSNAWAIVAATSGVVGCALLVLARAPEP